MSYDISFKVKVEGMGNCKVTQTLFDMYEQPEPPKEATHD